MPTKILILDGGLGTSLEQKYSVKFGKDTPLWSSHLLVAHPYTLQRCQNDFGNVPVDIILTATYQVSIEGFSKTVTNAFPAGVHRDNIPRFLEEAVRIADRAKGKDAQIALSIGPYGACMIPSQEYSGKYDAAHDSGAALESWHKERMQLFVSIRDATSRLADLALETIPRVDEIIAMRKALDFVPELATIPFWMSCLFPGDSALLPSGNSVDEALEAMLDPSVAKAVPWGVGINCTKVWKLDSILKSYEAAITRMLHDGRIAQWPALVLYPDGTNGEVYNTTTQEWEIPDEAKSQDRLPWDEQLADIVKATETRGRWRQIVVGGCCMASSEDIKGLRKRLTNA